MLALFTLALAGLSAPSQAALAAAEVRIERLDPRLDALIPLGARVERVVDGNAWSEGPLWDARDGSLLFSDVPRNAILRWKAGAGVTEFLARSGYGGAAPFAGAEPGSNGLAFDRDGACSSASTATGAARGWSATARAPCSRSATRAGA